MDACRTGLLTGLVDSLCLCVKSGGKRLEMTPPLPPEQFSRVSRQLAAQIRKHGLGLYLEENGELQNCQRYVWYLIYQDEQSIREYSILRVSGSNPAVDFQRFQRVFPSGSRQVDDFWDPEHLEQTYQTLFRYW